MSDETLTLRMRARGAALVKRDVDRVGRSVRGVGDDSKKSSRHVGIFSRALTIMRTRAVIATFAVAALGVATAAVVPSVLLLTAGLLALGATFAPAMLIGLGVMLRFQETVNQAGSAASELSDVLAEMKSVFGKVMTPAAGIVMRALSKAMVALLPIVRSFEPVFTTFARAMAQAMAVATDGIRELSPEFRELFTKSATLLVPLTQMLIPLIGAFVDAAIAGIPVAHQLIDWLTDFTFWLRGAVHSMDAFGHSAQAANSVSTVFGVVAEAARYVTSVVADVVAITVQLGRTLAPLAVLVGGALLLGLRGLAGALDWAAHNATAVQMVLVPLTAALIAYQVATTAVAVASKVAAAATWLLNFALNGNPIVRVVTLLALLASAIYIGYQRSERFRAIVDGVWRALKSAAQWAERAATAIKDSLAAAFQWAADKAEWLWKKIGPVVDAVQKIASFTPGGLAMKAGKGVLGKVGGLIPGLASGGTVVRGGAVAVHERGPEVMDLPSGTRVYPHGVVPDDRPVIHEHHVTLEVERHVLAQTVLREAYKKKSTR